MEDDRISVKLLNFQRTCTALPLFQPILLGVFFAVQVGLTSLCQF